MPEQAIAAPETRQAAATMRRQSVELTNTTRVQDGAVLALPQRRPIGRLVLELPRCGDRRRARACAGPVTMNVGTARSAVAPRR